VTAAHAASNITLPFYIQGTHRHTDGECATPQCLDAYHHGLRSNGSLVYETSALRCLQAQEMSEYVVCQSVLLHKLYPALPTSPHYVRFHALALLFYSCYTRNPYASANILAALSANQRAVCVCSTPLDSCNHERSDTTLVLRMTWYSLRCKCSTRLSIGRATGSCSSVPYPEHLPTNWQS
jgi:hypothetical protein